MEKNGKLTNGKWLIVNGTIVNADSTVKADLAIANGKIKAIGKLLSEHYKEYTIADANGMYVFPGGIDPHVHLALPTPAGNSSDNFISGTKAAFYGGTTAIIDFVTPTRGQSLIEALHRRQEEASASICCWKLHMGISEWNPSVKKEVIQCIRNEGIHSFKAYLAYRESIGIAQNELKELMEVIAVEGGVLLVHCEEHEMIKQLQQRFLSEGKTRAMYHAHSRPAETEINAIKDVIRLSGITGCPVYFVHISTGVGAELVRKAKQDGLNVLGETCIQYLIHNDSVYYPNLPDDKVLPFIISPPIRSEANREKLWEELAAGTFDTVATDHCPFNLKGQKERGKTDFTKIPNGTGSIEYRIPLLFTHGVNQGRISLQQFVSLTSTRAAEIFGWANEKGRIAKGYDADILIWNPAKEWTITRENQYQLCDSNIYEHQRVIGWNELTLCNGKLLS